MSELDFGKESQTFLQSHLKAAQQNDRIEIEARWKIKEDDYLRILAHFKATELTSTEIKTQDVIYGSIRQVTDETGQYYINKRSIACIFDTVYHCKIAVSNEETLCQQQIPSCKIILSRIKHRTSFLDKSVRIDITKISANQIDTKATSKKQNIQTAYEVEVEITNALEKHVLSRFNYACRNVYQNIHFIYNSCELKKMMGNNFFGALPKTLQYSDLCAIKKNDYAWSLKYDGSRRIFFIQDNQTVQIFDRSLKYMSSLPLMEPLLKVPVIFDVEFVDGSYVILDIIKMGAIDMRESKLNLFERVELCRQFTFTQQFRSHVVIVKQYYPKKDIYLYEEAERSSLPSDGIIFTMIDRPYSIKSRDDYLFKWKPIEKQTIDFRAVKVKDNDRVSLHISYSDSEKEFRPAAITLPLLLNKSQDIVHNDIVECKWDVKSNMLEYIRKRNDKDVPNFHSTVEDIWNFLQNPVSLKDLQKLLKS